MDNARDNLISKFSSNPDTPEKHSGLINKLNNTGIKFNLRLLHLTRHGLFYYTKFPSHWKDNDFDALKDPPKSGIALENISKITLPPEQLKRKKMFFSVEFDAKDKLNFKQGRNIGNAILTDDTVKINEALLPKAKDDPKKNRGKIKWIFSIDNIRGMKPNEVEQKQFEWIGIIAHNVDRKRKGYEAMPLQIVENDKKMEEIVNNVAQDDHEEEKRESDHIGDRDLESEKKRKEEEEIKKLREEEENKKMHKELELRKKREEEEKRREEEVQLLKQKEEEDRRKREEDDRKKREADNRKKKEQEMKKQFEEKKSKIESDWEFRYFQITEENISSLNNFDDNMKKGLKLFHFMGVFKNKAFEVVKSIIDGLSLPTNMRQYEPEIVRDSAGVVREYVYSLLNPNMFIRLAWPVYTKISGDEFHSSNNLKEDRNFYDDKKVKALGHEFRAMNILNDLLFNIRKQSSECIIRVPLAVLIDYRGLRALITSQPPISPKDGSTLILGPTLDGSYKYNQMISPWMKKIADQLNLKPHRFEWDPTKNSFQVMLSVFVELHKAQQNKWDELREVLQNMPDGNLDTGKFDLYYISKVADIFPVDVDVDSKDTTLFNKRLRPEFVFDYPKPLSADAFMMAVESPESELDDVEVAEAGRKLRENVLPALLQQLERLEVLPIDSRSISETFHVNGVNMRFLGWVCNKTALPHIKEICQVEMVARACKKIFRHHMSEIILNFNKENQDRVTSFSPTKRGGDDKKIKQGAGKIIQTSTSSKEVTPANIILGKLNDEILESVLDYLNLIFGSGEESDLFWTQILQKQIDIDFEYKVNKKDVVLGGLLHAVCYHCNLEVEFTNKIPLGKDPVPFRKDQIKSVKKKIKGFHLKNVEIKLLSEKYVTYRENKNPELCLKALSIKQSIERASDNLANVDVNFVLDFAEILLESSFREEAIAKAFSLTELRHAFHADISRAWTIIMKAHMKVNNVEKALEAFDNCLAILEFHLGPFHPYHATIYTIFGYYYAEKKRFDDAILLYKSSLVCCLRILGSNHIMTGEVYVDLANLYNKMNQKEEALGFYEKAYSVFDIYKHENGMQYATTCMQIAQIMKLQGKMKDAIEFAKKSLKTFEKEESQNYLKLIEGCLFVSGCGDVISSKDLCLEYAEHTWFYIIKYSVDEPIDFKEKTYKIVFSVLLKGVTNEQKHFLFRLFDSIIESLQNENKMPYSEDEESLLELKKKAIDILVDETTEIDGVGKFLSNMLYVLITNIKEFYRNNFFIDYRVNLMKIKEEELKSAVINYENLILLLGMNYFYDHLKT